MYEPAEAAAFRQHLLLSPGERQGVEYKASIPFAGSDSFSLKLIRHIQGMANADGGWLVIGYLEDQGRNLLPDPNHTEAVCATYEPTRLSQQVNSTVQRGQQLKLTVYFERHPNTNLRYPIISVAGFERTPYVCRSAHAAGDTGDNILRAGAVYLRRPGAETSEVSTAQDWEDVIALAVRKRRQEFLGEFSELFERMTSPKESPTSITARDFEEWTAGMRARALGTDS